MILFTSTSHDIGHAMCSGMVKKKSISIKDAQLLGLFSEAYILFIGHQGATLVLAKRPLKNSHLSVTSVSNFLMYLRPQALVSGHIVQKIQMVTVRKL